MHVLHSESVQIKNLFMCGYIITTLGFSDSTLTPTKYGYSQTYLVMYQAHEHHYLITPSYTSPYMDTPKMLF